MSRVARAFALLTAAAAILLGLELAPDSGASGSSSLPAVKHVFVIVLENEDEATTFGASSPAPSSCPGSVGTAGEELGYTQPFPLAWPFASSDALVATKFEKVAQSFWVARSGACPEIIAM